MSIVLKWMKNQFSDFYFLSYKWFCLQFSSTYTNQICLKIRFSQQIFLKQIFVFLSFFFYLIHTQTSKAKVLNPKIYRVQERSPSWGMRGEAPHKKIFYFQKFETFFFQTVSTFFFRSGHIYMKDAERAKINKKSIF